MTAVPERACIDLQPSPNPSPLARSGPRPDTEDDQKTITQRLLVGIFVGVPTLALAAAIPLAWGWALGWHDLIIGLVFYIITGLGVTVGYHRHFTHASVQGEDRPGRCTGDRGQHVAGRLGAHLGRYPPPSPQIQRP